RARWRLTSRRHVADALLHRSSKSDGITAKRLVEAVAHPRIESDLSPEPSGSCARLLRSFHPRRRYFAQAFETGRLAVGRCGVRAGSTSASNSESRPKARPQSACLGSDYRGLCTLLIRPARLLRSS